MIPRRRIQSSGGLRRCASTTSGANIVGNVAAQASASTTNGAIIAGNAARQATACTTSYAKTAGPAAAQTFANTTSYATTAGSAGAQTFASTARIATIAPTAKTSHALWKVAHNSATVSAQPESCWTTCAPSTAASPRRSPSPRS